MTNQICTKTQYIAKPANILPALSYISSIYQNIESYQL